MNLFLIRHGESEEGDVSDDLRALTPKGAELVARMAHKIAALPERPARLFTSPLRRARQTAEAYEKAWGLQAEVVDWLRPMAQPGLVLDQLGGGDAAGVALVGHLPCLGLVLTTLVWGLPPREVVIAKGGAAALHCPSLDPGSAKLRWLLTPDVL